MKPGVDIGDTVVVTHAGGLACGKVVEVRSAMSVWISIALGRGPTRPVYGCVGGIVVRCIDSAGWPFVASIGWTHPDTRLSIRRGMVCNDR